MTLKLMPTWWRIVKHFTVAPPFQPLPGPAQLESPHPSLSSIMSRSTPTRWHQAMVIPLLKASCKGIGVITEDAAGQEADPVCLRIWTPTQTALMSLQSSMMTEQQKVGNPDTRGPTGTNGQQVA